MLTRSDVAKRLGKCIATVRRMEGVELHPVRDERGVNRFDPDEVEAAAAGRAGEGAIHRAGWSSPGDPTEYFEDPLERRRDDQGERLYREIAEARDDAELWARRTREEFEAAKAERERAAQLREEATRELREQQQALRQQVEECELAQRVLNMVAQCSNRELRELMRHREFRELVAFAERTLPRR